MSTYEDITVLVCAFNAQRTLRRALESALDQTLPASEYRVLVVDDGSTDDTHEILGPYEVSGRIDVLRLPSNVGLSAACNAGLERVESRCFVRLDADDYFEPEMLEALLNARSTANANFVYTDRWESSVHGPRRLCRLPDRLEVGTLIASGVLMATDDVRSVGGYACVFWEEYDLYLRLLETGGCRPAHVARPLYDYTVGHPRQLTSDSQATAAGWRQLTDRWSAEILSRHGLDGFSGAMVASTHERSTQRLPV